MTELTIFKTEIDDYKRFPNLGFNVMAGIATDAVTVVNETIKAIVIRGEKETLLNLYG